MLETKEKLSRQLLGKFGECYAEMALASHGFVIYTPEVDDRGIDFVAEIDNEFLKFQVKTTTFGNGYPFVRKSKFNIDDDRLFLILVVIKDRAQNSNSMSNLDVFVIPACEWKNPQQPLVYHEFEGKKLEPEYGINISEKQYGQLMKYSLEKFALKRKSMDSLACYINEEKAIDQVAFNRIKGYIFDRDINELGIDDQVKAVRFIGQLARAEGGDDCKMPAIVGFDNDGKAVYWDMAEGSIILEAHYRAWGHTGFTTAIISSILNYSPNEFRYYLITDNPAPKFLREDEHCEAFVSLADKEERSVDDILELLEKEVKKRKSLSQDELKKEPFLLVAFSDLHHFDVDYDKYDKLFISLINNGSELKIACFTTSTTDDSKDICTKYKYTYFLYQVTDLDMHVFSHNDIEIIVWTNHFNLGFALASFDDFVSIGYDIPEVTYRSIED